MNKHTGSRFDDFLKEEGILEDVTTRAKQRLVRYSFDPTNPPQLTVQQEAELEALKARPDSEIDTSDIPVLSEEKWEKAVVGRFYKSPKKD